VIEVKDLDGVRTLKLAHGKVSAIDLELAEAMSAAIADAIAASVKAVIITGSGSSFSAGVDLFRLIQDGPDYARRFIPVLDDFLRVEFSGVFDFEWMRIASAPACAYASPRMRASS